LLRTAEEVGLDTPEVSVEALIWAMDSGAVLRGCCWKAIAGHDMLTERMQHMIDDVLPDGFLPTICGTDL
jgi:hypothetical protein